MDGWDDDDDDDDDDVRALQRIFRSLLLFDVSKINVQQTGMKRPKTRPASTGEYFCEILD